MGPATAMNLGRLLTQTARRVPDAVALAWGERRWTFAELDARVQFEQFAGFDGNTPVRKQARRQGGGVNASFWVETTEVATTVAMPSAAMARPI